MMLNIFRPLRMEATLPKEAERRARHLPELERLPQASMGCLYSICCRCPLNFLELPL